MSHKITRSYNLQISPNFQKLEDIRYSASRYGLYLQHFVTQLYFNTTIGFFSTAGMGTLANQAQKQAIGIVGGVRARKSEKTNCPQVELGVCPGSIAPSRSSSFVYWVTTISQWKNKIKVPAKSHRKLNDKLRTGWKLSKYCEITKDKDGKWFARVFVTKDVVVPEPKTKFMGVDVGIAHGAARSDGYLGKPLKKIMRMERLKQAERQRQKHPKKPFKTVVKQQLDREVNLALARCQAESRNLVVEHPKVLSNLRIDRWARSYFANRATERAIEEGVFVIWVNPVYTSITCSACGHLDKKSRVNQSTFKCLGCGNTVNADYNASVNIARKGQESLKRKQKAINPLEVLQFTGHG